MEVKEGEPESQGRFTGISTIYFFYQLFGGMPAGECRGGRIKSGGWRRKGLGETRLRYVQIGTGPRLSPSACSEILKKIDWSFFKKVTQRADGPRRSGRGSAYDGAVLETRWPMAVP